MRAICFKCGAAKSGALDRCPGCSASPISDHERVISRILSVEASKPQNLDRYSQDIAAYGFPIIDPTVLAAERAAYEGSDKETPERAPQIKSQPVATPRSAVLHESRGLPVPLNVRKPQDGTSLQKNAFYLLGATTRDNARRIVALAEERALSLDSEVCSKARSDLITPRTRLASEIAWLPGLAPQRAKDLLAKVQTDVDAVLNSEGIPPLAKANLMSDAFELHDLGIEAGRWSEWVRTFAEIIDSIETADVLRDINEDRSVSGVAEVRGLDAVDAELAARRAHYRDVVKNALNELPSEALLEVVTRVVSESTDNGETHAPLLIDELMDSYQTEVDGILQKGAQNVATLIEKIREVAPGGPRAVEPYIRRIDEALAGWHKVAKPIQLSMKARGLDHDASRDLGFAVRRLGLELYKNDAMVEVVQQLTSILSKRFEFVPELKHKLVEDASALEEARKTNDKWAREITYAAEVGILFKDTLSISPKGVQLKEKAYPLESVTRVRWGGVNNQGSVTYKIAIGDSRSETELSLTKADIYEAFTTKLWTAVCVRLLVELLERFKAGNKIRFGDAVLDDNGILLTRHKFLGSEQIYYAWNKVSYWSANGALIVAAQEDKKAYVSLSYMDDPNTHILEAVIRTSFKAWKGRLSGLLETRP